MKTTAFNALCALGLTAALAFAGCAEKDELRIAQVASIIDAAYETPAPVTDTGGRLSPQALSLDDGYKVQTLRVSYMKKEREFAGYKIAAAGKDMQEAFGLTAPVTGVFMKDMLLHNGSAVRISSGASLAYEADMIVRVGSAAINNAKTEQEVAAALDEGYVFIELPDLLGMNGGELHGGLIAAANAGARWGVMGGAFPISSNPGAVQDLQNMTVTMVDGSGAVLGRTDGPQNPLSPVLVLIKQLEARGTPLAKGDYISVGTFIAPSPAKAGQTLFVHYDGLTPERLSASVTFTE